MQVTIAHLYPIELNIYGDRGNIITLKKRLEWRGFRVNIEAIEPGSRFDVRKADIIFGGGGQDQGQVVVAADLQKRKSQLHEAIEAGIPALTICGAYQLFGHGFVTATGEELPGISIFKAITKASGERMIGNVVIDSPFGELVGFENHSGKTILEEGQKPLGQVIKGYGNNGKGKDEGAITKYAYGTYLHGPLLPKNPSLADEIIKHALKLRFGKSSLKPLNDTLEHHAAATAKRRPQ